MKTKKIRVSFEYTPNFNNYPGYIDTPELAASYDSLSYEGGNFPIGELVPGDAKVTFEVVEVDE